MKSVLRYTTEENVGSKHLCDQPHTAAVNVTELAFAAECRAAAALLLLSAGPTAANPPHAAAAVSSWERQTDRRTGTPYRYVDPAA